MDAEITVRMTAELREAVVRRIQARNRWRVTIGLVLILLMGGACLGVLAALEPDSPWLELPRVLILPGMLGFCVVTMVLCRRAALRAAREAAKRFGEVEVKMRITGEGLHFTSPYESGMYPWRIFLRVQRLPQMWLLYPNEASAFVLPADAVAPEVAQFIEAKVREAGGKVR